MKTPRQRPAALLGRIAGVPARLHEAGIALFSGAVGRDLAGDNELHGPLGLEDLDVGSLERLCRRGFGG